MQNPLRTGRWVLSWAGEAKVIRPAELAESVRQAAKRLLQSF
jgi:predicted DNA-binding transcriptional regulator YafY